MNSRNLLPRGMLDCTHPFFKITYALDSPGGTVDKPRRGRWFSPWSGKIPHAVEQPSRVPVTGAHSPEPGIHSF